MVFPGMQSGGLDDVLAAQSITDVLRIAPPWHYGRCYLSYLTIATRKCTAALQFWARMATVTKFHSVLRATSDDCDYHTGVTTELGGKGNRLQATSGHTDRV